MSLKEKIIAILVGVFIVYGAVDYAIQYLIIFPNFLKLEHQEAEQNLQRTVNAIHREIAHLDALCHDWASWDDSYDFVETRSQNYIDSNLISTFANNRINLLYIYNLQGQVVWGKVQDLLTGQSIDIKDFSSQNLPEHHPLLSYRFKQQPLQQMGVAGLLATTQGYLLVASRPILTSTGQGPTRGTLVMGQLLTPQFIESLVEQTQVSFEILPVQEFPVAAETTVIDEEPQLITVVDKTKNQLLIYKKMLDINNNVIFLIKIEIPRDVVARGLSALSYALISILGSDLIIIVVMLIFLNYTVIYPLKRLNKHVLSVEKNTNLSARIGMKRQDEIGILAREFDRMLEQIEKQTIELERINQELRDDIERRQQAEAALTIANRELERIAMLDGLTQIANRRYLDQYLQQEWKRLRREQQPIALIMCDVDCFKLYNDTYGHPLGDDCLRAIAKTLDRHLKIPGALAARYGGEEFSIVLPNTTPEDAKQFAELLRVQVQQLEITHIRSLVAPYITLSLGVVSMIPTLELSLPLFIALADKALYVAKREGRNRVILKTEKNMAEVLDYQ